MTSSTERDSCVFCGIVAGSVQASSVYEDDRVLAFMDIQPATTGHLLVVPKGHAACLEELDEDLGAHIFRVAHRLAGGLRLSGVPCGGVNFFLADGEVASQEVFHLHLHVLPRTVDDGFKIEAKWRRPDRAELDRTAALIRDGLTSTQRIGRS